MGSRGGDDIVARSEAIAERATAYAETAVEGIEIVSFDLIDGNQLPEVLRGREAPTVEDVKTADMETITHALARAFTLGYAAALDDRTPARSLGGVDEPTRKRRK